MIHLIFVGVIEGELKKYTKMHNIKGMIWNVGGFGDTAKHLFVKESIREHALDFIALLETGRSNFAIPFLNQLAGPFNYSWFCLPPQGRPGSILV
jgi:hypothetical protein